MASPRTIGLAFLVALVAAGSTASADESPVTMEFRDAPVSDVLRSLGDHYGVSIVVNGTIPVPVNVNLAGVPLDSALDLLLDGSGFLWTRDGSIVRVLSGSTPTSRVFSLRYTDAGEIARVFRDQLPDAVVTPEPYSNSLMVRGPMADMREIESALAKVDRYRAQVSIRAEMVEVTLTDSDILGIDLSALLDGTEGSAEFETNWSTGTEESRFRVTTFSGDFDITAVLNAIQVNREATLLSSPEITTLDNQPARIHVGERVPYQRSSLETETGSVLAQVEFMEVGVKLEVTPTISDEQSLYLAVHSEVSEVLDQSVQNVPRIGTREADTRVLVRHGETVVIGGLMKDNLIHTTKKVRFLGDIPLLGRLFRRDDVSKTKTEFLVFIHPYILSHPSEMSPDEHEQAVRKRAMGASD